MEIADAINQAQREAREADEQVVAARSRLARHLSLSAKSPGQQTLAHARAAVRRRVTMGGFTRLIDEDEGLPPPTRAPSYSTTTRLKKLLPDVSAGLVSTLLVLVLNVSGAGLVCADAALRPHVDILVVLSLMCTAVSTAVLACLSPTVVVVNIDAFGASQFYHMARHIVAHEPAPAAPFCTTLVAMAVASLIIGLCFLLLGVLKAGKAVQFLPSPVMAGYLASVGYVLVDSASTFLTECPLIDPGCIWQSPERLQLLLAATLGSLLYAAQRATAGLGVLPHALLPLLVVAGSLVFAAARWMAGAGEPDDAAAASWKLWLLPLGEGPPANMFTLLSPEVLSWFRGVDYGLALYQGAVTALTALLPMVSGRLLAYSAIEQLMDVDVTYDAELRWNGVMHLVAAPMAFTPAVSPAATALAANVGMRTHLAPLVVAAVCALFALTGVSIVGLVPQVLFAMVLCTAGVKLFVEQVRGAAKVLSLPEVLMVLGHVVATATLGMLYAIALGVLATAFFFILEYSRNSGVSQTGTVLLERSKVVRPPNEQARLEESGGSVLVIHLHGMVFFGSANSVVEHVRAHTAFGDPLRCLLLDFTSAAGLDSSAVGVLMQTRRHIAGARLVLAAAKPAVFEMLVRGAPRAGLFEHFTTLDLALEHCENVLLAAPPPGRRSPGNTPMGSPALTAVAGEMPPRLLQRGATLEALPESLLGGRGRSSTSVGAAAASSASGVGGDGSVPERVLSAAEAARWRPELLTKVQGRVLRLMGAAGAPEGLEAIVRSMDLALLQPGTVLYDQRAAGAAASPADEDHYLWLVEGGFVSIYLKVKRKRRGKGSLGGTAGALDPGQSYRIAKVGPGAVLNVDEFVSPRAHREHRASSIPAVAITETYCQLLRLPRSRCKALETSEPVAMCALYRFLAHVSQVRLHEQAVAEFAHEELGVAIHPSASFQRLLASDDGGAPPFDAPRGRASVAEGGGEANKQAKSPKERSAPATTRAPRWKHGHAPRELISLQHFQNALALRDKQRRAENRRKRDAAGAAAAGGGRRDGEKRASAVGGAGAAAAAAAATTTTKAAAAAASVAPSPSADTLPRASSHTILDSLLSFSRTRDERHPESAILTTPPPAPAAAPAAVRWSDPAPAAAALDDETPPPPRIEHAQTSPSAIPSSAPPPDRLGSLDALLAGDDDDDDAEVEAAGAPAAAAPAAAPSADGAAPSRVSISVEMAEVAAEAAARGLVSPPPVATAPSAPLPPAGGGLKPIKASASMQWSFVPSSLSMDTFEWASKVHGQREPPSASRRAAAPAAAPPAGGPPSGGVPPPGSLRRQLSSVEERLFEHEEASRASQRAMAIEGDSSSSSDSEG